jgi:hypothetical protein
MTDNIVDQINTAHKAVLKAGNTALDNAFTAGRLLADMFEKVKTDKGNWAKWLKKNCPDISPRTDNVYRALAEKEQEIRAAIAADTRSTAAKSMRWALKLIAKKRSTSSSSSAKKSSTAKAGDLATLLPSIGPDEVFDVLVGAWGKNDTDKLKTLSEKLDGHLHLDIPPAFDRRGEAQLAQT